MELEPKKRSVIEEIWRDRRYQGVYNTPELQKAAHRTVECDTALRNALTEEQIALFENYETADFDYDDLAAERVFTYGFRLGARMVLETMQEEP